IFNFHTCYVTDNHFPKDKTCISVFLRSSSILWEMIVSNVTCMKIEYIRLKHAKWMVWSFKPNKYYMTLLSTNLQK
ncbi:hypothetical protein LDENG_00244210, partial [Lucifuga dentata]